MAKRKRGKRRGGLPATYPDRMISVYINPEEPRVTALVLTDEKQELALRAWELVDEGIAVACECEKPDCPKNNLLLKPEVPEAIELQIQEEIEALRGEYRVPTPRVGFGTKVEGVHTVLPHFQLGGKWKDETAVRRARAAFLATVAREHHEELVPLELPEFMKGMSWDETKEVERFAQLAYGLLTYEGALRSDELIEIVAGLGDFGSWFSPQRAREIIETDPRFVWPKGDIVSIEEVQNPRRVMAEKAARKLPPKRFTVQELLAVAAGDVPLTPLEKKVEDTLNRRSRWRFSVRDIQLKIKNTDRPTEIMDEIMARLDFKDAADANRTLQPLMRLWNATPRYELRGRSPDEVGRLRG
ncbi:MAG: hypothetical protein ACE5NP_02200 [Anaerolineae bacterium]